jgi:hypothetical protein
VSKYAYEKSYFQKITAGQRMSNWNPGVAWKDGKLYLFSKTDIVVMRLWPDMLAWRRTKTKAWYSIRRHADEVLCSSGRKANQFTSTFVGPHEDCHKKRAQHNAEYVFAPALETIPAREEALAFSLTERRWHALALMARCPGATDLFESNPGLAFCLASNWVFHRPGVQQPLRSARALITKKQTDIQAWLGFPSTERVRKILTRIDPSALRIRTIARFQRVIQDADVQNQLVHIPCIGHSTLNFACDRDAQPRLTNRFLQQLNDKDLAAKDSAEYFKLWTDLKFQAQMLRDGLPAAIHSLEQLRRAHDLASIKFRLKNASFIAEARYGEPPFPGITEITPIVSGIELLKEGEEMKHCVASRSYLMNGGSYFVYRVTAPIRATMAITRKGSAWEMAEIKGVGNEPISEAIANECFRRLEQTSKHLV